MSHSDHSGRHSHGDGIFHRLYLAALWKPGPRQLQIRLDHRCMVTRKGKKMFVDIAGEFTEAELEHKARGVQRVWEWEAA
jgi:hypothetical protein